MARGAGGKQGELASLSLFNVTAEGEPKKSRVLRRERET